MKVNKSSALYLLLILLNWSCYSTKNLSVEPKSKIEIVDFQVDKLGNYYTLSNEGVLNKYNDSQKLPYSYSNSIYGVATMVDVTNPHKILLFFKNHQRIILLDNTLSEKKLDDKGNTLEESLPITNINPKTIKKSKIYDFGKKLLINDKEKGILLFDNLGYYEKTIKLQNVNNPLLSKDNLIYFDDKDKMIKAYDLRLNQEETIDNIQKIAHNPIAAFIKNQKLYILSYKGVVYIVQDRI